MLVAVYAIATRALAQEPVQAQAAARNAFPVTSTVRVTRDIVYAEYGSRRLKLDLYLPPQSNPSKMYPGVVVVRGGGWRQGDKEAFGFIAGPGGNAATSSEVQAVVAMACVCNLDVDDGGGAISQFIGTPLSAHADAVRLGSPVAHVSPRSAPLLLLHSRTDPVVPYAMSTEIEERYRRAGATAVLKTVDAPNTHAFWNQTKYFPETMRLAVDFFRTHLK
jgi:fermentation-respiration switch protein FrsA (DUF1100 family)